MRTAYEYMGRRHCGRLFAILVRRSGFQQNEELGKSEGANHQLEQLAGRPVRIAERRPGELFRKAIGWPVARRLALRYRLSLILAGQSM